MAYYGAGAWHVYVARREQCDVSDDLRGNVNRAQG